MNPSAETHRVLVVGPWRATTGGGCCAGDPRHALGVTARHDDHSGHRRAAAERNEAAGLVRLLREREPDVDVQLVDPRNTPFLVAAVFGDARRAGRGVVSALRQAVRATTPWAVVVDGEVRSRGVPRGYEEVRGFIHPG